MQHYVVMDTGGTLYSGCSDLKSYQILRWHYLRLIMGLFFLNKQLIGNKSVLEWKRSKNRLCQLNLASGKRKMQMLELVSLNIYPPRCYRETPLAVQSGGRGGRCTIQGS